MLISRRSTLPLLFAAASLAACASSPDDSAAASDDAITGTISESVAQRELASALICPTMHAYEELDPRLLSLVTKAQYVADRRWAARTLTPNTSRIGSLTVEHAGAMFGVWVVEDKTSGPTVQKFFTGEGAPIATAIYNAPSASGLWSDTHGSIIHCGAAEPHDETLEQGRSRIVISRILPKRDTGPRHDLVELFNRTSKPISLEGLSLQASEDTSGTGADLSSLGQVLPLHGEIAANGFFLVAVSAPSAAPSDPAKPDLVGEAFVLRPHDGKVALAKTTTSVRCGGQGDPCVLSQFYDFVGYGASGDAEMPAALLGAGMERRGNGCQDSDANETDFTRSAIVARNTASAPFVCP